MKKGKEILKEASVLLIAIIMVLSTSVMAQTEEQNTPVISVEGSGQGPGAIGDVVWDNGMDYIGLVTAQFDEQYPFESEVADDFHFEEDTEVCDVHWVGGYWQTGYDTAHWPWEITFYKDDGTGEKPGGIYVGPLTFEEGEYTETLIEDTGTSIYYELSVDLPENYLFYACEKYWISIQGIGIFPPQSGIGYHSEVLLSEMVFRSEFFGYSEWTGATEAWGEERDLCFQLTTKGQEEASVDIEKYVWDPCQQEWVDADTEAEALDLPICTDVTFKIVMHNDGECPIFNIYVYDVMHDSLKYLSADPEPDDFAYDPPFYYMLWLFPGPLDPCNIIEIYITAHVEGPECSIDFNYVEVIAESNCEPYYVSDWDYAYVHAYENDPPTAPTINGPDKGPAGTELCWTFHSTDPEGDAVQYIIDWGDGTTDTTDCYPSCTPVEVCHTYESKGTYTIKAKAKECCWGLESPESTLEIKIPRARSVNHPLFQKIFDRFENAFPFLRYILGL